MLKFGDKIRMINCYEYSLKNMQENANLFLKFCEQIKQRSLIMKYV